MAGDFNGIVSEIQTNTGRTDSTAVTNATLAANRAMRNIEKAGNWYWMEAVKNATAPATGTTDRLALPSDWKEIRAPFQWFDPLATSVRHPMDEISEGQAIAQYDQDTTGDPMAYRIWKGQVYVYPPLRAADRTLRMPYWAYSPLISGAQTNELSTNWTDLWVIRGTVEYLRILREFKAAKAWLGDARDPEPGTYMYELAILKRDNARRKLPRSLAAQPDSRQGSRVRLLYDYPWWGH